VRLDGGQSTVNHGSAIFMLHIASQGRIANVKMRLGDDDKVHLLAKLKGTNLTTFVSDGIDSRSGVTVAREKTDPELLRLLRGNWEGKEAAVQKVVQACNRFPLKQIRAEARVALGFGTRYFASSTSP
jgi:hypothetical protein